jgi:hypothetical protein
LLCCIHRHLSNIDCFMAHTACLCKCILIMCWSHRILAEGKCSLLLASSFYQTCKCQEVNGSEPFLSTEGFPRRT